MLKWEKESSWGNGTKNAHLDSWTLIQFGLGQLQMEALLQMVLVLVMLHGSVHSAELSLHRHTWSSSKFVYCNSCGTLIVSDNFIFKCWGYPLPWTVMRKETDLPFKSVSAPIWYNCYSLHYLAHPPPTGQAIYRGSHIGVGTYNKLVFYMQYWLLGV